MGFLGLTLLFHLAAGQSAPFNLADYELLREGVAHKEGGTSWKYVLHYPKTALRLPLGYRRLPDDANEWDGNVGLNEESLSVSWLAENEIVWVSWTTWYQGQGINTVTAHVLALIEDGRFVELLRESFMSYVRESGGVGHVNQDVSFSWDGEKRRVLCKVERNETGTLEHPSPLAHKIDESRFVRDITLEQETVYQLRENTLREVSQKSQLHLGAREAQAGEVAELFVVFLAPRWKEFPGRGECTRLERDTMLQDMNMGPTQICTGRVRCPAYIPILMPIREGGEYYPF